MLICFCFKICLFLCSKTLLQNVSKQKYFELLYFERSPPWHFFAVSDMSSGNTYGITFWHSILAFYLAFNLTFFSGILFGIFSDILSGILRGIYTDIFSGILSGIFCAICSGIRSGMLSAILSDILFWHSIWYIFGYFLWLRSGREHSDPELAAEVRQGTLWSGASGGGPAGNTLIQSSRLRSARERFDPELPVEVRRGTLWSWVCGGGPAGNTLIRSLRWRFGGEHFDPELAVEVWRGTLWSRGCCWGPAVNTAILELALKVRRRKEEEGRGRRASSNNPHLTGGEKSLKI